ncbi:ExbD/TolR family protein [Massilia putida]|uniref:ExbD/TolR family protein n=1 Tax=Massilia putida TaxID=1141883 RepID=UPI0009533CBE|nr:biopolymer transporter ExbD [Massilia putida]
MDFRRGRKREDPEINLIPFIDVLLVVLIFLMVTTTYSKFTELQITLPTADAEKAVEKPFEINVTVDAKGNYTVNNVPVAFHGVASLADDLKRAASIGPDGRPLAAPVKGPVIIVNADQFAMHQMVINVLEAARMAGYDKLTFAAQTGGQK